MDNTKARAVSPDKDQMSWDNTRTKSTLHRSFFRDLYDPQSSDSHSKSEFEDNEHTHDLSSDEDQPHPTTVNITKRLFTFDEDSDEEGDTLGDTHNHNNPMRTHHSMPTQTVTPPTKKLKSPTFCPVTPIAVAAFSSPFQNHHDQQRTPFEEDIMMMDDEDTLSISSPSVVTRIRRRPVPDPSAFDTSLQSCKNSITTPKRSPALMCPPTPIQKPYHWKKGELSFYEDSSSPCSSSEDSSLSLSADPETPSRGLTRSHSLRASKLLLRLPHFYPKDLHDDGPASDPASESECSTSSHAIHQQFENLGWIGSGQFAEVYKMRHRRDNRIYAVKQSKRQFRSKRDRSRLLREIEMYTRLHPQGKAPCEHIIQYYQAWQDNGYFYIQTELCEMGSLKHMVETTTHDMSESSLWNIIRDVATGLAFIHAAGIVHLDIKPQNICITKSGVLKIGDFGTAIELARLAQDEEEEECDSMYMAYEILNDRNVRPSADIFSFGIMLYELATRRTLPQEGSYWLELRDNRIPPFPPGRYSLDLENLIRKMMDRDATRRPAASVMLKHPVFQNPSDVVHPPA